MRIAYFDCFSGISGDMILGALLDAGLSLEALQKEIDKLRLKNYSLEVRKVKKHDITGTDFQVKSSTQPKGKGRALKEILKIIEESHLDKKTKEQSQRIFQCLAEVESQIHQLPAQEIHFHELGGLDSLIDVVGALVGLKLLQIEEVHSSKIPLSRGFVQCSHGVLPVPAPAAVALLKGVPVYYLDIEAELVTPTGAAIISNVAKSFGKMPQMKIETIGYGAGKRDLEIPNLLRVYIGETEAKPKDYQEDTVMVLQTNVDDMNPEFYDYVIDKLLAQGALDVFLTPVYMKKNRPGTMLTVLTSPENTTPLIDILFNETTTLGIRIAETKRKCLKRESIEVETKYGKVRVKISKLGEEIKNIAPEYQDCKRIAQETQVPLKEIYEEAKKAVEKTK